jgi:hypothetical protein
MVCVQPDAWSRWVVVTDSPSICCFTWYVIPFVHPAWSVGDWTCAHATFTSSDAPSGGAHAIAVTNGGHCGRVQVHPPHCAPFSSRLSHVYSAGFRAMRSCEGEWKPGRVVVFSLGWAGTPRLLRL